MQAPIGGNVEVRRWLVVTDQALKDEIAAAYRVAAVPYLETALRDATERGDSQKQRVIESASFLAAHLERVPLLVIPCLVPDVDLSSNEAAASRYASVFPAVWSFQLALRSRGLGSVLTTLHLHEESRVAQLLRIPISVSQVALLPVAYTIGENFRAARRIDAKAVTYWNAWPKADLPVP
jgi:nitroreductase